MYKNTPELAAVEAVEEEMRDAIWGDLESFKKALDKCPDLNMPINNTYTLLTAVLLWNLTDKALELIGRGAEVKKADLNGNTPLKMAQTRGNGEVLKALQAKDATPDSTDKASLFNIAASTGHIEDVQKYISSGIDPNILISTDRCRNTPLHRAVENNHVDVVKLLINAEHINVNATDIADNTPLHLAAKCGYLDIAEALVNAKGIDLNCSDYYDGSPYMIAKVNGHQDIANLLLSHGATQNVCLMDLLDAKLISSENFHVEVLSNSNNQSPAVTNAFIKPNIADNKNTAQLCDSMDKDISDIEMTLSSFGKKLIKRF